MLMKGHSKQRGCQGQEPEGVKEYGKSQGSQWPGVAPVGVAVERKLCGGWKARGQGTQPKTPCPCESARDWEPELRGEVSFCSLWKEEEGEPAGSGQYLP